jgi:cytochrome P450
MNLVSDLDLPVFDYSAPDFSADRYHQQLAETSQQGWLAKSPLAYIVLDHDSGEFFLRSRATAFPGRQIAEFFGVTGGPLADHIDANILNLTGEQHRRLRALVGPAFTPRRADRWRPVMRGFLEDLWSQAAPNSNCDFVASVARPFPSLTIATVLGAPHQDAGRLQEWSSWVQRQFDIRALSTNRDDIERAVVEVQDYVTALLEDRRAAPSDDLISDLLAARDQGDRLSAAECVQLVANLLAGGIDTTTAQLAHAIRLFAGHPAQWALLAADPALASRAVDEVLRFEPVTPFTARICLDQVEHRDVIFPAGTIVAVCAERANREGGAGRSSTSPRPATPGCSRSAPGRTIAWAPTWPGPNWKRPWRSSRRGPPTSPSTVRPSWAGSKASTESTSSRSPGRAQPWRAPGQTSHNQPVLVRGEHVP